MGLGFLRARLLFIAVVSASLIACGGGGSTPSAPQTYTVTVNVSGLSGTGLTLSNNSTDSLSISGNNIQSFPNKLESNDNYAVSIINQPASPAQTCTVTNATGTVTSNNISNINIDCITNSYTVSVNVSGLDGSGLILQNNARDSLTVTSRGQNSFTTRIQDGDTYNVSVLTQPTGLSQSCTVNNPANTISGASPTNISVNCVTNQFTVGGSITGLFSSVTLQNNGGDDLIIPGGTASFIFDTALMDGNAFAVTVLTNPTAPNQSCTVTLGGSGDVAGQAVTSVEILCENVYQVGGSVSGLNGTGLQITDGVETLTLNSNGIFAFSKLLLSGDSYSISLATQPTGPAQQCTITNNINTVGATNVSDIQIDCLNAVEALYSNAQNWNDYVQNDGGDIFSATNLSCTGAETGGYSSCLHGGEIRSFEVSGQTSCTDLIAVDTIDAFDWQCIETTPYVSMVSTVLNTGKYLSDLIDWAGISPTWKDNAIEVSNSSGVLMVSASTPWWNNSISDVSALATLNLTTPGTIWGVTADPSQPITFGADSLGLVVKPGVTISNSTGGNNTYVVFGLQKQFLWLEGVFDATNINQYGVYWYDVIHSVMKNISSRNAETAASVNYGIACYQCDDNHLEDLVLENNVSGPGMRLDQSSYNTIKNTISRANGTYGIFVNSTLSIGNEIDTAVTSENENGAGIYVTGAVDTVIHDVVSSQNKRGVSLGGSSSSTLYNATIIGNIDYGLDINNANNAVAVNVTVANHQRDGVLVNGANNILVNITSVNNRLTNGFYMNLGADYNILLNTTAANNGRGWYFLGANNNTVLNTAATNNGDWGIYFSAANGNVFSGAVKVGNNPTADCASTAAGAGLDGACANEGSSDATLTVGVSQAGTFVGKVTVDASNGSDTVGVAQLGTITDFVSFDNLYRGWGYDGSAFPNLDNRGHCGGLLNTATDNCRIWDWRVNNTDSVVLDVNTTIPTGNDALTHTWSVANGSTTVTFLKNTTEIMGDGIGNDNGLCESNETCLFTPNLGSYQGHGSLVSAGTFIDGILSGITLVKHIGNGI